MPKFLYLFKNNIFNINKKIESIIPPFLLPSEGMARALQT
jgi:hypothetical protein